MKNGIVILDGARTPFGSFMGSLRSLSATDLGVIAATGALARSGVDPALVGHVVWGNVLHTSADATYISRHVGLKAGLPIESSALTLNRQCGSGLEAVLTGAKTIMAGETECVLAGGAENMSQAPYVLRGAREGWGLGQGRMEDYLWVALTDSYNNLGMALTAENLAAQYKICREEQDAFALRSQQRASAARSSGRLGREIVPVEIKGKKGPTVIDQDEYIRADATLEKLAALAARFRENGTVTAGNASGLNDGADTAAGDNAGTGRGRLQQDLGGPELGRDLMRDGVPGQPHLDEVLLGAGAALSDRHRDLVRLPDADAHVALTIASNHQGAETQSLTALHYLGHAVDVHQFVIQR